MMIASYLAVQLDSREIFWLEGSEDSIFAKPLKPERSAPRHGVERGFLPCAHAETLHCLWSVTHCSPGTNMLGEVRGEEEQGGFAL